MSGPSRHPLRAAVEEDLLDWTCAREWKSDESRFDRNARRLFAYQFEHCAPYRRLCRRVGANPEHIGHWSEIPAVPAAAFKEFELRCFPASATRHVFRTSGTSSERRGQLFLDTLELYEASLRPNFERHVLAGLALPARMRIVAPAPREVPDSSLSHMFGVAVRLWGDARSGFDVRDGRLRFDSLWAELEEAAREERPAVLAGTAFAWVHCLDECAARGVRTALPRGSRLMETGGFKGRSRTIPREELYAGLGAAFGIPATSIVNQYGMTELGSQFYDSVVADPGSPRHKAAPPWTRVRVVDPASDRDVAVGAVGQIVIYDLANTGSVLAVSTADLGRRLEAGFEVLGRSADAEARGCSLGADLLLGS